MESLGMWIGILLSFLALLTTLVLSFSKWLSKKFEVLESDSKTRTKEIEQRYTRILNDFKGELALGHKEQEEKISDLVIKSLENKRRIESVAEEMLHQKELTKEKIVSINSSIENLLSRFEAGFHELSAALKENTMEVQKLTIKLTAHIAESDGRNNAKS